MRVGERILTLLFRYPHLHKDRYPDAIARVEEAEKALRVAAEWDTFKVRYKQGSEKTHVLQFGLSRQQAKDIMVFLADDIMPLLVREDDPHFEHWQLLLGHYCSAIEIMRRQPPIIKGSPGFDEHIDAIADEMQLDLDEACAAALRIEGDKVMSNYMCWLRSGFYKYWIKKAKTLPYYWTNDGAERTNEDQQVWFFNHTPRGGGNREKEERTFAAGLAHFAMMKVAFVTGQAAEWAGVAFSEPARAERRKNPRLADPEFRRLHNIGGRAANLARRPGSRAAACAKRAARILAIREAQGAPLPIGQPETMDVSRG